jgi:hypothetical protein
MKRTITACLFLFIAGCLLPGCREMAFPPPGSYSEILLVTEDGKQSTYLNLIMEGIGKELDFYTSQEKEFEVTVIPADKFTTTPMQKNIVLVGVIDQLTSIGQVIGTLIGEDGVRKVTGGEATVLKRENIPAPGLLTLIITARSDAELENVLRERTAEIPDIIEASCRSRIRRFHLDYLNKDLARHLFRTYGFNLEIPKYYVLNSESKQPAGIELLRDEPARSLGVFWVDWKHEPGLKDASALFELRADYVFKRYDGDAMDSTRVSFSRTQLGPYEAVEMEGYWYSTTATAGGCYKTFFVYEEKEKLLWAIDTLIYAPGRSKNPLFRELISIAETFRYD